MKHRILHLCSDANFIDNTVSVFEKYYPGQNVFFLKTTNKRKETAYVRRNDYIKFNPFSKSEYLNQIEIINNREHFDIIVLHGLYKPYVDILKHINLDRKKRVYWVFWGYELYWSLGEQGRYHLLDDHSPFSFLSWITPTRYSCITRFLLGKTIYHKILKEFLPLGDYFCFWFYEDYLLLKKFYPNNLQYKFFSYGALYKDDIVPDEAINFDKTKKEIRISHSASTTANHITVMKILRRIDKGNEYKKVFPLAYGNTYVKKKVVKCGKKWFGNQFVPIFEYEKKDEYLNSLAKVGIAIFGQIRQEGVGNIAPLLKNGAKIFLREKSPLYQYYKNKGYVVFSIESDLKSVDDLEILTPEQMLHNYKICVQSRMYYEDFMPYLFDEDKLV